MPYFHPRKAVVLLGFAACLCALDASAQKKKTRAADRFDPRARVGPQSDQSFIVPTAQVIDPAGHTVTFPGRPMDLALSPDGSTLAVKNLQNIVFFDVSTQSIRQTLNLPSGGGSFAGIGWSDGGKQLWVTDTRGYLRAARMKDDGKFAWETQILLPSKFLPDGQYASENEILEKYSRAEKGRQYPGGFAIDEAAGLIYVTLNLSNAVGIVDMRSGKFLQPIAVGIAPYTVVLAGRKAYVSNWGGRLPHKGDKTAMSAGTQVVIDARTGVAASGTVSVIDLSTRKMVKEITVGLHPSAMVLSADGSRLYVANSNSDRISVIDTKTDAVTATLDPRPQSDLPLGSAPDGLALSKDGRTLYVANGGNNCLALIDLEKKKLKGLIPTGWYPGAVLLDQKSDMLFVANIKGVGTRNLASGAKGYKSNDHLGSVSFIPVPSSGKLDEYTLKAASNMRLPKIADALDMKKVPSRTVPVPTRPGEHSVFRHVLYIIKENKTYDQVFGDIKKGNGDSSFCQFGYYITPNHHALAENFVLLDNTYCNGVLSADGHQWTDEGYVTDYLEKSFGGHIRSYPYRGDDPLAFSSAGFIWDEVLRSGQSFRNYGEFVDLDITEPRNFTWQQMWAQFKNNTNEIRISATTKLHTLTPYNCPTYPGFTGKIPDVYRAREFIKELHAFEEKGDLPNFMTLLLPNDHTVGVNPGLPTPAAAVADNDLALGQIVEAVSKSKFWKETVIFVVQDDPQSGLDHVDGKRTVALCISPYTKRGAVVSTQYNQNSLLRTIELILGLPPMTQFDLVAEPMTDCFTTVPDLTPYIARANNVPLDQLNPAVSSLKGKPLYWAKRSLSMPLEEADEADDMTLNKIIWHAMKGYDVPYPVKLKADRD